MCVHQVELPNPSPDGIPSLPIRSGVLSQPRSSLTGLVTQHGKESEKLAGKQRDNIDREDNGPLLNNLFEP
jgi:hypothetical protein